MPGRQLVLVIDGGAVILFVVALAAVFFAWRFSSKRKSAVKAAKAADLERLLHHLKQFADEGRDANPALNYIASEIELFCERKKL